MRVRLQPAPAIKTSHIRGSLPSQSTMSKNRKGDCSAVVTARLARSQTATRWLSITWLLAALAGLLLQMLNAGARCRRGRRRVFHIVVCGTARVRWAIRRTARKLPIGVVKIYGPADSVTEAGRIGISNLTHNERNLIVLIVGIVCIPHRSIERGGDRQGCRA